MAFAGLHKYAVKFLLSLAIIGAALLIGVYFLLQWHLDAPGPLDAEIVIDIPKGSSSRAIVRQLAERNIINYPLLFSAQLWLQHNNQRLQAGEYSFTPHVSVKDTITKLTKGEVVLHKFIIVEGLTSHTILENLRANELLTGEIMDSMPEATLLPETYYFTKGEKRTALLERAATNLHEFINKSWAERDLHPNINSINELLTLASIVEKETSLAEERPLVACVFLNRLKLNMRLLKAS